MIADNLEMVLKGAGYRVVGIAGTLAAAVALADQDRPDLAIIDLRLAGGQYGTPIGAALCDMAPGDMGRVGVLYATGNPDHKLLDQARGVGVIGKPYSADGMLRALECVRAVMRDPDSAPAPRQGLRLLR